MQELNVLIVAGVVSLCVGFVISTRRRAALVRRAIATPEDARRFADAIVTDLALYNDGIFAAGAEASPAFVAVIAEGRDIFTSRVPVELHHVYDDAIAKARGA